MADPNPQSSNGSAAEAPAKSLREIAEQAWEDVVENAPDDDDDGGEPAQPVDGGVQQRDEKGRWVARTPETPAPGEADGAQPSQPRQVEPAPQQPDGQAQPRPAGEAAEAPAHWAPADRETFAKLPQEARDFLLRRHGEMEADYTRKVQAVAPAVAFSRALAPTFGNPALQRSLQENGLTPLEAINEWASVHLMAVGPMEGRIDMLHRLAARMGIRINPAAIGPSTPGSPATPGFTPQELADPGIRFIADRIGQITSDVAAQRAELQRMQQDTTARQQEETLRVHRWGIDSFAEQKDQQGNLLHPDFDAALPRIIELFRADPNRDLREAYETAIWMDPALRAKAMQAERAKESRAAADRQAAAAARLNTRGRSAPVTAQAGADGKPLSLRETLEATADEVGL